MNDRRTKHPRATIEAGDPSAADLGSEHAEVATDGGETAKDVAATPAGAAASILDAEHPSSASIHRKLNELAAQRDDTLRAIAQAEAFEADNLLKVDDAALAENDDKIIRLRRQAARLDKLEEMIREALAEAEAREAEQGRVERYAAAQVLAAEADRWICTVYPTHAAAIGTGLAKLTEIRAAIDKVNGDRPGGVPLLDADAACKIPEPPRQPPTITEVFYVDSEGDRVRVGAGDQVREVGERTFIGDHDRREVFKRQGQVRNPNYSNSPTYQAPPLDRTVILPRGAHGTKDHWPPG